MPFGWEGNKVRLVPLDKERHFANCVRWLNDPTITEWTLVGDLPLTNAAEEEFFERVCKDTSTDVLFAIETLEEEHIGIAGIHSIDYRHGVAITGTLIGRKQFHRRGYGSDAIAIRTRYAFDVLGLRLLLTEVLAGNIGSLKAVQHCGYREVGRTPARWWKRGAYHDSVHLALTHDEWQAQHNT